MLIGISNKHLTKIIISVILVQLISILKQDLARTSISLQNLRDRVPEANVLPAQSVKILRKKTKIKRHSRPGILGPVASQQRRTLTKENIL